MKPRSLVVDLAVVLLLLLAIVSSVRAADPEDCHPIPVRWYSPTGIAGCAVYGVGTASMWAGPGAARNDCLWPFRGCQAIAIQSLTTGVRIVITPTMFGDLYTGTSRERIVDLSPELVAALGLRAEDGLWPVRVTPVDADGFDIPDTALAKPPK